MCSYVGIYNTVCVFTKIEIIANKKGNKSNKRPDLFAFNTQHIYIISLKDIDITIPLDP